MNDSLFKPAPQWQGPATKGETTFAFLERGGRTEATGIRQWTEEWFRAFPAIHSGHLKRMLQSEDFSAFMGAYFELQVFAMLRRLGCCVEVHPRFSGTCGTVDFRVAHDQDSFYVEATVCGINQGKLHSNTNEEDAVGKIRDVLGEPHSDIWLHATGELRKTLGKDQLVDPIKDLLGRYGPDDVRRLKKEPPWRLPRTSIRENGWRLEGRVGGVVAEPLPPQTRACAIDALGSSPDRFAQGALP